VFQNLQEGLEEYKQELKRYSQPLKYVKNHRAESLVAENYSIKRALEVQDNYLRTYQELRCQLWKLIGMARALGLTEAEERVIWAELNIQYLDQLDKP